MISKRARHTRHPDDNSDGGGGRWRQRFIPAQQICIRTAVHIHPDVDANAHPYANTDADANAHPDTDIDADTNAHPYAYPRSEAEC